MKSQLIIETNQKTSVSELVDLADLSTRFDYVESRTDSVAYGIDKMLIAGFVFVFSTIGSGIAWDVIKASVSYVKDVLSNRASASKQRPINAIFEINIETDTRNCVLLIESSGVFEADIAIAKLSDEWDRLGNESREPFLHLVFRSGEIKEYKP